MIVHVHALCWNEEEMLPFFFRHYDRVADRYFIYDDGSTDRSRELLADNPRVTLRRFETAGDSFVAAARRHYDECWKTSRRAADWVIVCNIDEHCCHPELRTYLARCQEHGISVIVPEGYEMYAETLPSAGAALCRAVQRGCRARYMDKPEIFNPTDIEEINFSLGRHRARPTGRVCVLGDSDVKLLHFKYVGFEYTLARYSALARRRRRGDVEEGCGGQYAWSRERLRSEFEYLRSHSVKVSQ
jgi:hypothetical protein